jgi:hypothetical protein
LLVLIRGRGRGCPHFRAACAVLVGLRGVQVLVASAIPTAVFPQRFTVLENRAFAEVRCNRVPLLEPFGRTSDGRHRT